MKKILLTLLLLTEIPGLLPAADEAEAQLAQAQANEQRVRDTLRMTTQQLRAADTEKAGLLAAQAEKDEKIAALEAQVKALAARANEDKTQADKSIGDLKASVLKQEREVARLGTTLDKWKAAYNQAVSVLKKTDAVRARLDAQNITLERKVTDRETKNLELYKTGREILQRYTDYSLGRAILAREPFTGIARARLEEQLQGYADKLEDQRLKPVPSDGKLSTAPSASEAGSKKLTPSSDAGATPPTKPSTQPKPKS